MSTIYPLQRNIISTFNAIFDQHKRVSLQSSKIVEQFIIDAIGPSTYNYSYNIFHLKCLFIACFQLFQRGISVGKSLEIG